MLKLKRDTVASSDLFRGLNMCIMKTSHFRGSKQSSNKKVDACTWTPLQRVSLGHICGVKKGAQGLDASPHEYGTWADPLVRWCPFINYCWPLSSIFKQWCVCFVCLEIWYATMPYIVPVQTHRLDTSMEHLWNCRVFAGRWKHANAKHFDEMLVIIFLRNMNHSSSNSPHYT